MEFKKEEKAAGTDKENYQIYRCRPCNKFLFRGKLGGGTVIHIRCPRCKIDNNYEVETGTVKVDES